MVFRIVRLEEFRYLNPREGTETFHAAILALTFSFRYLNPREGTETKTGLTMYRPENPFRYLNPREGTETACVCNPYHQLL